MTYLRKSTIKLPYGGLEEIGPETPPEDVWTEEEIGQLMLRKKRLALQIVSNCREEITPSGRALLTKQLKQLMELDQFGKCNGLPCDQECYEREMESHSFYLAFENSVCPEYVTEKFWNAMRRLTVPVVLKRSIPRGLGIPDDAFIAADDFASANALADQLKALQHNRTRYASYFNWTKKYRKNWDFSRPRTPLCQLCQLAHEHLDGQRAPNQWVDINDFRTQRDCQNEFVQKALFKKMP